MANSSQKPLSFRRIYINLISVSSIIMIAVGTVLLTQYVVNRMVGQKYQLNYDEESQCRYSAPRTTEPLSNDDIQRAREARDRCLQNLEAIRINRQTADLTAPLIFEVMGVILFITLFGVLRKKWEA